MDDFVNDINKYEQMSKDQKKQYLCRLINDANVAMLRMKNNAKEIIKAPFISAKSKAMLLSVITDMEYGCSILEKYKSGEIDIFDEELKTFLIVIFPNTIRTMNVCAAITDREIRNNIKTELRKAIADSDEIPDDVLDEMVQSMIDNVQKANKEKNIDNIENEGELYL